MLMFIARIRQSGRGCATSIGCGTVVWRLLATGKQAAIDEVSSFFDPGGQYDLDEIAEIVIYEVTAATVLDPQMVRDQQEVAERARQEQAERAEYERLKRKYEAVS